MRHHLATPKSILKKYIDYYFIFENNTDSPTSFVDVFPSPGTSMVFSFGNNDITVSSNKDQKQKKCADFALDTYVLHKRKFIGPNNLGILVVSFKPCAIHNFIPFHIKEIPNNRIDLKDIYSNEIEQLENRLLVASTDEERISIVETFLISVYNDWTTSRKILNACDIIKKSAGMMPVHHIAKIVDLSEKQFYRNFTESTGISPKLYSRLERFYYAVTKLNNQHVSLTDVALDSGYFDQAHFIHEFKRFAQTTPKQYLNNQENTFFGHPLNL